MILFRTFSNQPKPGLWSMFFLKSSLSCLKVGQLQLVTAARGNRSGSGFEAELAAEQPAANFPTSCCSSSARPDFGETGDESLRKAQLGCSQNSLLLHPTLRSSESGSAASGCPKVCHGTLNNLR